MEIEELKLEHKEQWVKLWKIYLEIYGISHSPYNIEIVFNRLCEPSEKQMGCFVATENGEILGFITYIIMRNTWHPRDVCYLQDVYVCEKARGRKLGRTMMQKVIDLAKERKLKQLFWLVNQDNKTAISLYETMGNDEGYRVFRLPLIDE